MMCHVLFMALYFYHHITLNKTWRSSVFSLKYCLFTGLFSFLAFLFPPFDFPVLNMTSFRCTLLSLFLLFTPHCLWHSIIVIPAQNMTYPYVVFITADFPFFHILFTTSKIFEYFRFISFIFFIFSSQIFVIIPLWGSARSSSLSAFNLFTPY